MRTMTYMDIAEGLFRTVSDIQYQGLTEIYGQHMYQMRFVSNNKFNTFRDNIMYENPF